MATDATGEAASPAEDRWGAYALVLGARVAGTVQMASVGALGPALLADPALGPGYTGLGLLIGAYMLPGAFVALPAGWLAGRFGERRLVLAGLALSVAGGLAFAAATGFGTALAARLAAGAGAALLNVVLSAMVMARFPGASLAPAMGGFLAANPFGVGVSMLVLPAIAAAFSWRAAMLAVAAACALCLAALPLALAARAARAGPAPAVAQGTLQPGEWGPVLAAGGAWVCMNVGYVVLYGFTPALLTERGATPEAAGAIGSLVGWASIPLAPIGGMLAERTGRPLLATAACLAAAATAALALSAGIGPASGALLGAGLLGSIAATVIMTLPARVLASESRAFGMGVFWTIFYAGMTTLPPLAGWVADESGGAAAALVVAAAFFAATVAGLAIYAASRAWPSARGAGP